jgi:hypothetical protein
MRDLLNLLDNLITEAPLAQKTFYEKARLQNLIRRLKAKDDFLTVDGDKIKIPVTREELKNLVDLLQTNYDASDNVISNKRMPTVLGGVPLSNLMKTNDFGGRAGIGAQGETEGKANIGPTTETMKSIAVFTRLLNRNKSAITVEDWNQVAKQIKNNATDVKAPGKTVSTTLSELTKKVYDTNKKVQDTLKLTIELSTPPFLRAVNVDQSDRQAWGILQGILSYVNTESDVQKYNRFFTNNNVQDPVNIAVVGIGGDKVDILATRTAPTGEERPLSHLSMSIKAGSSMYEQSSGMNVEGIEKLYDILGLDPLSAADAMRAVKFQAKERNKDDTPEEAKQRVQAVKDIYQIVGSQLKTYMSSKNDAGESEYLKTFLSKLKNSIQGDQRLVYVNFDAKGTYNKLNPQVIDTLASYVDLGVVVDAESKSTPYIYIIDKNTGKPIMHVRLAILKSGRLTNTFELDYLLDLVRDAQKKQNQTASPVTQTQPVRSITTPPSITPSSTTDQTQGGVIDVDDQDEEPAVRLTGPGAKTAKKPTQPQMTAEVLGRERRGR